MNRLVAGLVLCALVGAGPASAVTVTDAATTDRAIAADASAAASANATVDAESLELHNDAGQTIAGTVDAESGAGVEVYLRVPAKLVVRSYATAEDGRFATTFDLSDLEPGTTIDGKVSVDGEAATEFQIEVVEGEGDGGPSGSTDDGSTDDSDSAPSGSTDDGSTGGADNTSTDDTDDGSTTENESSTDQNSTDDETTDDARSSTDDTSDNQSSSEETSQNASDETDPSTNETEEGTQNENQSSGDSLPGFGVLPALFGLLGARRLIDR